MADQDRPPNGRAWPPPPMDENAHHFRRPIAAEVYNAWVCFLQQLNSLTTAGHRLSQAICGLSLEVNSHMNASFTYNSRSVPVSTQCQASWEELQRATAIASYTVHAQITRSLYQYNTFHNTRGHLSESEAQNLREAADKIACDHVLSLVHVTYQFCLASTECLGNVTACPSCRTPSGQLHQPDCTLAPIRQSFARMYGSNNDHNDVPSYGMMAQPSLPTLGPFNVPPPPIAHPQFSADGRFLGQGSVSSSESPISPYMHAQESYRNASPTQHQEHARPMSVVEGYRPAEPRGPSPLAGYQESILGPSPVYRGGAGGGPLPSPGLLAASTFANQNPHTVKLFQLDGGQRRWSEAAAAEMGALNGGEEWMMRRWSMPWDGRAGMGMFPPPPPPANLLLQLQYLRRRLINAISDQSLSATPGAEWASIGTSVTGGSAAAPDGLIDAIQLLSCRPRSGLLCPSPGSGLASTNAGYATPSYGGWPARSSIPLPQHSGYGHGARVSDTSDSSEPGGGTSALDLSTTGVVSRSSPYTLEVAGQDQPVRDYSMWSGNDSLSILRHTAPESSDTTEE